jgi:colanic acid/amylovoran biosynthesis glycosyltransferase
MDVHCDKPCVAHSTHPYLPMSQSWIYNQLVHLERYRPIVFTKRVENLERFPMAGLYPLYAYRWWRVAFEKLQRRRVGYFPYRRRIMRTQQARLLHSHSGTYGREDYRLAQAAGCPHVVSFYGSDIWQGSRDPACLAAYRRLFAASDLFLVEGHAMRKKVIALGCPEQKVRVHHLGIPLDGIPFTPRRVKPDEPIVILMAGRAIEKKGHLVGLRAFARLAGRHPRLRLTIMTWGDYDESRRNLAALHTFVAEQALGDRVTITGQRPYDEYLALTRACHLLLNPSVHAANGDAEGGFPVTITELMAGGMPVVASDHCDTPEIVLDGQTGLLAPEGDVEALADAIERLAAAPETWIAFAERGRAHIAAEYNAQIQAQRLEAMYDRLLATGAVGANPQRR